MPEETNKKLQYLKRDEVRTMEKDIARLREAESEKARGQIAEIKTKEELLKEGGRMEQAQRDVEERERMAAEAKQKEEEIKKARESRAANLSAEAASDAVKTEEEKERLRAQFKEAQLREEEARRKFLENISRQSGEEPVPTPPIPIPMPIPRPTPPLPAVVPPSGTKEGPIPQRPIPPTPPPPLPAEAPAEAKEGLPADLPKKPVGQLPKVQLPKVTGYFPGKPSIFEKIWIRIVASLFILAILTTIATFWYWYLVVREKSIIIPLAPPEKIEVKEATPPLTLIPVGDTRTLEVLIPEELPDLLFQTLNEDPGEAGLIRLLIKSEKGILGLREFFEAFQVKTPADFYNNINNDFTLFVFSSSPKNQLGFVAKTENPAVLRSIMESWEKTLEEDSGNLFLFLNENRMISGQAFLRAGYKNTTIHYLSLAENFGIVWAVTDNYLVFTSSGESAVKAIDKIKE